MGTIVFDRQQPLEIQGLTWTPKRIFPDDRGAVLHMLKSDEIEFPNGELYFSEINPGVIKGWKFHNEMKQRFCVPTGFVRFVFVDDRPNSLTRGQVVIQDCNRERYGVITVPERIWYSFRCMSSSPALVANAASIHHRAGESEVKELKHFDLYQWP